MDREQEEARNPAAKNFLQRQAKVARFIEYFNHDRPHQAALEVTSVGQDIKPFSEFPCPADDGAAIDSGDG